VYGLGVEHGGARLGVDGVAGIRQIYEGSARFGTVSKMDEPFLIPHCLQRFAGNGGERRGDIGLAEGAESVLVVELL